MWFAMGMTEPEGVPAEPESKAAKKLRLRAERKAKWEAEQQVRLATISASRLATRQARRAEHARRRAEWLAARDRGEDPPLPPPVVL